MVNDKYLGLTIVGFITILVGVILIGALGDSISLAVTIGDVVNETITIATQAGTTANDDLTGVSYFGNTTQNTLLNATTIRIGTEVNWTKAGAIVTFPVFTDANYNISYTYETDEYVTNNTARTLIPLTNIFFAIAVLTSGLLMAFAGFKGMGIL